MAEPGSPDYREAIRIWNGAIDRHPALVVRCGSSADVASALGFAQDLGLEVSVRGGGHNFAGFAVTEGGLMVDLTPLKSVQVDPATRTAVAGGGVTWAELDAAGQQHALAVPGGFISHTGIAGLTLGGGMGWLSRLGGFSCDNMTGAEVVTAGGRVLQASAEEHPDLFWALRGGGGNFGVVTEFRYRMHQVGPVVNLGVFFVELDRGAEVLRCARELFDGLPTDLTMFVAGLSFPPAPFVPAQQQGQPGWVLAMVGYGSPEAHERAVAPVRAALSPLFELVTPIPYVNLQQMFDESAPWGSRGYEKGIFLEDLTDGAIDTITRNQPLKKSPLTFTPIFCLGGAVADTPEDATAFGGSRSTRYVVNMAAVAESQEDYEQDRQWARDCWSALVPHAGGVASYVNFMSEYDEDRVKASYGAAKYERLARIKREYDPGNVFHLNANIRPAG